MLIGYVGFILPPYARSIAPDFLALDEEYRNRNAVLQATRDYLDPTIPLHVVGPLMPGVVFYSQRPVVFVPDEAISSLMSESTVAYVLAVSAFSPHFGASGFSLVREQGNWSLWERRLSPEIATAL